MKKDFLWSLLAIMMVTMLNAGLSSCKKDDPDPELSVSTNSIKFASAASGSQTFSVSSNVGWTINANPSWLTVNPTTGSGNGVVSASVTESTEFADRTGSITIISTEGGIIKTIDVTQEGMKASLSVSPTSFSDIDGKMGGSVTFNITANVSWEINSDAGWLSLSTSSGNGNSSVTATAQANNTDSRRTATLTIKGKEGNPPSVTVTITQGEGTNTKLNVSPKTIIALADGIAFDFSYGSDVMYYYCKMYTKKTAERYTDAELISDMSSNSSDRDTPSDGYVAYWSGMTPLTEYVACTVGYDRNGKSGSLMRTPISTKSATNQAAAYISEVKYSDTYWYWTTTPNGYVTKYYQWFIGNLNIHYIEGNAAVAWFFDQAMKQNPNDFAPIVKGDDWQRARNGATIFDVVTWAVDVNGNFSGVIDRFSGSVNARKQASSNGEITVAKYKIKDYVTK